MRQEFRNALTSWRGQKVIDEREEYPNEEEGCGVMTSQVHTTKNVDMQLGTEDLNTPQMVTTTIQHRGGDANKIIPAKSDMTHGLIFKTSRLALESNNYGPLPEDKIKARPFKAIKKVS
mmetsp:Transcript_23642/g.21008  ORF Transcript_23642/g.21008 Transcript_23642/m.21008 type:complete len:119 (+) Transcript_23642:124-480(+)